LSSWSAQNQGRHLARRLMPLRFKPPGAPCSSRLGAEDQVGPQLGEGSSGRMIVAEIDILRPREAVCFAGLRACVPASLHLRDKVVGQRRGPRSSGIRRRPTPRSRLVAVEGSRSRNSVSRRLRKGRPSRDFICRDFGPRATQGFTAGGISCRKSFGNWFRRSAGTHLHSAPPGQAVP